jgi:aryl-alcohol dehydrogenase (NADP+)
MIGNWISSRRQRPELVTKTFNPMETGADHGLARARVTHQLDSSLDRLGVDHVDLYLAHEFDPDTPLEETFAAFSDLAGIGLMKAYGISNFDADQLRAALGVGRPAALQNSYSLLERGDETEVLALCSEFDVAYLPFSPLAGGWLAGKYTRDAPPPPGSRMTMRPEPYAHLQTDATFDGLERMGEIAAGKGVDMATLAIAWLLAQPAVTAVVVGPRRPDQLEPALRAFESPLTKAEADELAAVFS